MSDSQCYLCGKPGTFQKLLRRCKHESACHECLRNRYVKQAKKTTNYPLQCFHPECNLALGTPHMERLAQSKQELQTFHRLTASAKINRLRLGDNWKEVMAILGEALGNIEICRCPDCQMLITKNGGCDHMRCICGCDFNWYYHRRSIEESCEYIKKKYSHLDLCHAFDKTKRAPVLRIDDDFLGDFDDYSYSSEVEQEALDSYDAVGPAEDCTQVVNPSFSDLYSVPSDIDSVPSLGPEESLLDESKTDLDFHVLEFASNASGDSWSHFDDDDDVAYESSSIIATNEIQSSSQATWEEVSEVSSVVSFHSKTGMSFLEVARATCNSPTKSNGWKEVSKVPKPTIRLSTIREHSKRVATVVESDDDQENQMFDADFVWDGAKCSRGGKEKFMFKHQPRRKYRGFKKEPSIYVRKRLVVTVKDTVKFTP